MELIPIDELIKFLQDKNINLGKGNPYNRLRYYTKIGWIPHMTRKKNSSGVIMGHYPKDITDKITQIENLKSQGKNNDEIDKILNPKISDEKTKFTFDKALVLFKRININYLFILIIILGFFIEFVRNSPINNNKLSNEILKEENSRNINITKTGISFIPKNQNVIFVPVESISPTSVIIITFYSDIGVNNSHFVGNIKLNQGFYLQLSKQVSEEIKFSWVILN
jgi:hypothetical protein